MIPNNLSLLVTDVLSYHQRKERIFVPARNFSAITLRLKTPGKYLCNGKMISFASAGAFTQHYAGLI